MMDMNDRKNYGIIFECSRNVVNWKWANVVFTVHPLDNVADEIAKGIAA